MLELLKDKYRAYVSPDRSYFGIKRWTRTKWKVTGEWKEGWSDLGGYYNTLERVLEVYKQERIKDKLEGDEAITLKQIADEIKNIKQELYDVLSLPKSEIISNLKPSDIPKHKVS